MGDTRENSLAAREGMGLQHKGTGHCIFLPSTADPSSVLDSLHHELSLQLSLTPSLLGLPCPSFHISVSGLFPELQKLTQLGVGSPHTGPSGLLEELHPGVTVSHRQPIPRLPCSGGTTLKDILGPGSNKAQLLTGQ